jgi:hypothetical protein
VKQGLHKKTEEKLSPGDVSDSPSISNARRKSIVPPKQQPFELRVQRKMSVAHSKGERPVIDFTPPVPPLPLPVPSLLTSNVNKLQAVPPPLPVSNLSNTPKYPISNINNPTCDPAVTNSATNNSEVADPVKSKTGKDDEYINALETEILQLEMIQVNNE